MTGDSEWVRGTAPFLSDQPWTAIDCLHVLHLVLKDGLPAGRPALQKVADGADDDAIDIRLGRRIFRIHIQDLGSDSLQDLAAHPR